MTAFSLGDKVLFARDNTAHVGTVREATSVAAEDGYIIDACNFSSFAETGLIARLPDDALMLRPGDLVRVNTDAPYHAGVYGTATSPEIRGDQFGYWVYLGRAGERDWIPSRALTVLTLAGGGGAS